MNEVKGVTKVSVTVRRKIQHDFDVMSAFTLLSPLDALRDVLLYASPFMLFFFFQEDAVKTRVKKSVV